MSSTDTSVHHRRRRPGRAWRSPASSALRGVDCMLIEKRDGAITVPKQSMVSLAQHGVLPPLGHRRDRCARRCGPRAIRATSSISTSMRGRELLRVKVPAYAQRDTRDFTPEPPCPCPQIYFDPILVDRARRLYRTWRCATTRSIDRLHAGRRRRHRRGDRSDDAAAAQHADGALSGRLRRAGGLRPRRRSASARGPRRRSRTASTSSFARRAWRPCTTRAGRASTA